mgnify:CR=1 FL=1
MGSLFSFSSIFFKNIRVFDNKHLDLFLRRINQEMIKQALELGYYISFAGPITFKNSKNAPAIIDMVPLDKMLIETDSPYLSPEPHRGQRNDCRNVKYVAQKIADLKGISLEEIAKQTYENAMKIFEIEK